MKIKIYISLGSPNSWSEHRFTYAFKRKDGLVYMASIMAISRSEAQRAIRKRHLLELGELAGTTIPMIEATLKIKEIVRCGN